MEIGSTNGCSAAVYVNGQKAKPYNINKRALEIGGLLVPGHNEIRVEVSSTLNNRLLARGYYDTSVQNSMLLMEGANNGNMELETNTDGQGMVSETNADGQCAVSKADSSAADEKEASPSSNFMNISAKVEDYGMTGKVVLKTYRNANNEPKGGSYK